MTLDTRIYVLDRIGPREVFDFCRDLIGAQPHHTFSEGTGGFSNNPGQGLPAWLMLHHGSGNPLRTAEDAAAHNEGCNLPGREWYDAASGSCDGEHPFRRACWLEVSFDTAYGYSDDRGFDCGDLYAEYIARLGRWLDERGVRWEWMNEFTCEVHTGYERLPELGSGGFAASAWFRTAVLPAIASAVLAADAAPATEDGAPC